jgi:Phosphotransferase enzyme family
VSTVQRSELRLGELLAEGGEGRVFEVLSAPAELGSQRVYKELRRPVPVPELSSLVAFPLLLASRDAPLSARVASSSAWPLSVVVGRDPELALGTVLPRAPHEFWVRHRDGTNRLASLSYLANDPDRIAVAYGVMMPAPGAPERVALVYALARLLDAWQSGPDEPQVVHGDLSAKNVLWSLRPAPAVYVLDCDGATVTTGGSEGPGTGDELDQAAERDKPDDADDLDHPDQAGLTAPTAGHSGSLNGDAGSHSLVAQPRAARARATTPNWGDPAVRPGGPPTGASDRYLLAIAFLRVVGAAHFPIQGHQKGGQKVNVDLELPRSWRKLPDMPGLWELCERSLSLVNAADRPTPGEWVAHLEQLLGVLSAPELAASVRQAQGDLRPATTAANGSVTAQELPSVTVPDVVVRPVLGHRPPSTWQLISARPPLGVGGELFAGMAGGRSAFGGGGLAGWSGVTGVSGGSGTQQPPTPRQMLHHVMVMWGAAHRAAARWARSPGRRAYGVRRMAGVLVLDIAAACVAVFVVAMIISPWIGL